MNVSLINYTKCTLKHLLESVTLLQFQYRVSEKKIKLT